MAQIEMPQLRCDDFLDDVGGGFVRKMSVAAQNSLLQTPGTLRIILEHFDIVICFQQKDVCLANSFHHESRRVTQISEKPDFNTGGVQEKADRIISVVRHAKGFDSNAPHFEAAAGHKNSRVKVIFKLEFDGFFGQAIAINRNAQFATEREQSLGMIGMFVRDQDPLKAFRGASNLGEALSNLAAAEAGVDQNTRVIHFEIRAIAAGAAAENRELYCHNSKGYGNPIGRAIPFLKKWQPFGFG